MSNSENVEMVSCGKCQSVNSVPFGLEKFKCYGCGSTVQIARETTAACAAASSEALLVEQQGEGTYSERVTTVAPDVRKSESEKGGVGGGSFFDKMSKNMTKAKKEMEKGLKTLIGEEPSEQQRTLTPAARAATNRGPLGEFDAEEEQMQWALGASLSQNRQPLVATPAPTSSSLPVGGRPGGAPPRARSESDGQQQQGLQHAREAAEKDALKRQLDESTSLIQGLTQQLDSLNAKLAEKDNMIKLMQNQLRAAMGERDAQRDRDEDVSENQGTIAQLLTRVAELEEMLLRATSFAPEPSAHVGPTIRSSGELDEAAAGAERTHPEEERRHAETTEVACVKAEQEVAVVVAAEKARLEEEKRHAEAAEVERIKVEQDAAAAAATEKARLQEETRAEAERIKAEQDAAAGAAEKARLEDEERSAEAARAAAANDAEKSASEAAHVKADGDIATGAFRRLAASVADTESFEKLAANVFGEYDTDKSGALSKNEMAPLLTKLADDIFQMWKAKTPDLDERFKSELVSEMKWELDANFDGSVSKEEFVANVKQLVENHSA